MFDVLEDFDNNDHFFYTPDSKMEEVFNAPKTGMGVYLVYQLKQGRITLVFVGAAGKVDKSGRRKTKIGFFEELVKGEQFGGKRATTWKKKMLEEEIDALDIYWYETFNNNIKVIPALVQALVIHSQFEISGRLPEWMEEF